MLTNIKKGNTSVSSLPVRFALNWARQGEKLRRHVPTAFFPQVSEAEKRE